jgi:hypothetical protein
MKKEFGRKRRKMGSLEEYLVVKKTRRINQLRASRARVFLKILLLLYRHPPLPPLTRLALASPIR